MRILPLFSGSQGNCTFVEAGNARFLIDAGVSLRALERALTDRDIAPETLSAVLITHEHSDHVGGLLPLVKKYRLPVHITETSARALTPAPELAGYLVPHGPEFRLPLANGEIEAFAVPHDSAACVGYRITSDGEAFGLATDLGYVTRRVYDRLLGCRTVMIEANHDRDLVRNGPYPPALKTRILSGGGHLSNDDCAGLALALAKGGTTTFWLAHISRENNTPERALAAVRAALAGYPVTVSAAPRVPRAADRPAVV